MIFTSRFGALAARPDFRDPEAAPEIELQRELDELLEYQNAGQVSDERVS